MAIYIKCVKCNSCFDISDFWACVHIIPLPVSICENCKNKIADESKQIESKEGGE